ncbi:MAG: DUF3754 domain-containing protein [Phycisphaerales bacterium]|nr:DUF3754 domain-containing protein [Phycisphaerales bacterium]
MQDRVRDIAGDGPSADGVPGVSPGPPASGARTTRALSVEDPGAAGDPPSEEPVFHLPDDRFIPIRAEDLGGAMARDSAFLGPDAPLLAPFLRELEGVIEQEASAMERSLAKRYEVFNPDRDTIDVRSGAPGSLPRPAEFEQIHRWLAYLLDKANFERLDAVNLEAVVKQAGNSSIKIRIRPDRIEHLDLWVRGKSTAARRSRTWKAPVRGEEREIGVYRRLTVMGRLRDQQTVFIKMFREIPFNDVEALLPHAEIRMSWFDRIKVWGGGAGAVGGGAAKLLQVGLAVSVGKLAWLLIVPLGGLAIRSFFGYRTAKIHRESQRTRNLYYQNMASNAAAIHTLVSLISQEEIKEALLCYAVCHARAAEGLDAQDENAIAEAARAYLRDRFGIEVQFDVRDALETLDRLGLRVRAGGATTVLPLREAVAHLVEHWTARRSEGYHEAMVTGVGVAPSLKGTRWG